MPNSLYPDQTGHFFWPDLGLNCLQSLLADNTSCQADRDIGHVISNNVAF